MFVLRRQFFDFDVGMRQQERGHHVVPNGETAQKDQMQLVPGPVLGFAEGPAGVGPGLEDTTLETFNSDTVRSKQTVCSGVDKSGKSHRLLPSGSFRCHFLEEAGLTCTRKKLAVHRQMERETLQLFPTYHAAACFDRFIK